MLRLAKLRLLAARWQIATIHLEGPAEGMSGPTDVVLGYRSPRQIKRLANRDARLRIVDDSSAYYRLKSSEEPLEALYVVLENLLRLPTRRSIRTDASLASDHNPEE